jgi:nucleoside-diphosphate-sugar epimerase
MRVLVAGATGVLGRALVPQLRDAGHEVLGMARTPEKLVLVDRLGATAIRGDVLDGPAMLQLVTERRPDAIVNLATAIPLKLRIQTKDWEQNDRVRVEGTRNLLAATRRTGLTLFVQESAGYVCRSRDDDWIDEDSPLSEHPFLRATQEMEAMVKAPDVPATLLRLGALAAADSWHIQQSVVALRRGLLPIIGDGSAYLSLIHVEDAAQAFVKALAMPQRAAGRVYNVVDDMPARMREVWPYVAKRLEAPPPRHVPPLVARMAVGALTLEILTPSYRMSNTRIREELGFTPRYRTYRDTWDQITEALRGRPITASPDLP